MGNFIILAIIVMEKNTVPVLACSKKGPWLHDLNSDTIKFTERIVRFMGTGKILSFDIWSKMLFMAMVNFTNGVSLSMRGFITEGSKMERGPRLTKMVRGQR
jgi:hypothetical protein